jgi:hypothetical protein
LAVCWFINATEQPVSSKTLTINFFSSWCTTMFIIGRVPRVGVFLAFFEFLTSGSSICFLFDIPQIRRVLECGGSWPPKNPTPNHPMVGRFFGLSLPPLSRQRQFFVALEAGLVPPLPSSSCHLRLLLPTRVYVARTFLLSW